jgi:hypothetical protein
MSVVVNAAIALLSKVAPWLEDLGNVRDLMEAICQTYPVDPTKPPVPLHEFDEGPAGSHTGVLKVAPLTILQHVCGGDAARFGLTCEPNGAGKAIKKVFANGTIGRVMQRRIEYPCATHFQSRSVARCEGMRLAGGGT